MFGNVPRFVQTGKPIPFPLGTSVKAHNPTWALYINPALNRSWLGYRTPGGTRIMPLGGVKNVKYDTKKLGEYVAQRQYTTCSECD